MKIKKLALPAAVLLLAMTPSGLVTAASQEEMETVYEQCRNSCTRQHTRDVTICAITPGSISKLQSCVREAHDELRACWAEC